MDVVDPLAAAAWIVLSILVLVGVRWRSAQIIGAFLLAGLAISLLEVLPGEVARSLVASAGESPSEACRDQFFYPMIDGTRDMARTAMVPIAVLAIWVMLGSLDMEAPYQRRIRTIGPPWSRRSPAGAEPRRVHALGLD